MGRWGSTPDWRYLGPDRLPPKIRAIWCVLRGQTVIYNATIRNGEIVLGPKGGCVMNVLITGTTNTAFRFDGRDT